MMGKKGMSGGAELLWSSRYLAMLWNGFMKPDRSCEGVEGCVVNEGVRGVSSECVKVRVVKGMG